MRITAKKTTVVAVAICVAVTIRFLTVERPSTVTHPVASVESISTGELNVDARSGELVPLKHVAAREPAAIEEIIELNPVPATQVKVRSSRGLPLAGLRLRTDEVGEWVTVTVPAGVSEVTLPLAPFAQAIVAPGHAPGLITPDISELVLEPDALLEIQVTGSSRTARIASHANRTNFVEREVGWISLLQTEDSFTVAAQPDLANTGTGKVPEVRLALELDSGWSLDIKWQPVSGRYDIWTIPDQFGGQQSIAPLLVKARPTASVASLGRGFEWQLSRTTTGRSTSSSVDVTMQWGHVVASRHQSLGGPVRASTNVAEVVFEDAVVDSRYVVTCIASDKSRLGRAEFVFEGQEVAVELVENSSAALQLVDSQSELPLVNTAVRFDLYFGDRECLDGLCVWNTHIDLTTDAVGRVQACLNPKVAIQAGVAFPPPDSVQMMITTDGFEPNTFEVSRNSATGVIDMGVVRMVRRRPVMVVSGIDESNEPYWLLLTNLAEESAFRVESRTVEVNGQEATAIFAGEDTDEDALREHLNRETVQQPAGLLLAGDLHLRGVVRSGTEWTAEESQSWELDIIDGRAEGSTGRIEVGVRWRGADHRLGWIRPENGSRWSFDAPAEGLSLWSRVVDDGNRLTPKVEYAISQNARITVR